MSSSAVRLVKLTRVLVDQSYARLRQTQRRFDTILAQHYTRRI